MSRVLRVSARSSLLFLLVTALPAQTYKAIGEYKLAGTSAKGIEVDSDGRRLFVADGDGVTVLNADTGAAIGTIGGLKGAQDVMLIPGRNGEEKAPSTKGFASDEAGHVVAFSLADMKPTATIKLETTGAASLCYDVDAKTVEAVSASGSLTTIDADSNKVIKAGKIVTGTGQIVCGNMGHVYVADPASNVVHVLNHETMKNDGDYPMKTGNKPSGLALDTKGRRLFVSCEDGTIEIIDTDSGFTFIELKGGAGAARETFAWLPQGKGQWKAAAFVAQEDGTLSGIRMNAFINYSMGGQYKLGPGLRSIAYDDKTHHLFITSMDSGTPVVVVAGY
jgi:DNA-binding beta-propeller fold protein YncE